jgi:hypothetical protein
MESLVSRRSFISGAGSLAIASRVSSALAATPPLNIGFILADDLGYADQLWLARGNLCTGPFALNLSKGSFCTRLFHSEHEWFDRLTTSGKPMQRFS